MKIGEPIDSPIQIPLPRLGPTRLLSVNSLALLKRSFHTSKFPPIDLVVLLFCFCPLNSVVTSIVRVDRRRTLEG